MKCCAIFILLIVLIISSCEKDTSRNVIETEINMDQFSDQDIQKLLNKKVFFGHMSVGYNIIDGLKDIINEEPRLSGLSIVEITENIDSIKLGLYHQRNGKNGFPASKCDAFKDFLTENNFGTQFDIACFKFCYVDFKEDSDIKDIFDYYSNTIEEVEKTFPNLKVIHVTVPLMAHNINIKQKIKSLFKKDLANIKRNEFNQLLINKYKKTHSIFDLAQAESTYPDLKREYFVAGGQEYFSLIKDYTYDGGHLNKTGRKWVAGKFLEVLLESN